METNFPSGYAALSDEELLLIAASRSQLQDDALLALDSEMARRGLTYEQAHAKKRELAWLTAEENRQRRPKPKETKYFVARPKVYWALVVVAAVTVAYLLVVPRPYRIPAEWEEPALLAVMGVSVAFFCVRPSVRQAVRFWFSVIVSCIVQALVCYWFTARFGSHPGSVGKLIWLVSISAGYAVAAGLFLVLQRFKPEQEVPEEPL